MATANVQDQIEEYRKRYATQSLFTAQAEALIRTLLGQNGINCQLIESRTKSVEGFTDKLQRPTKSYTDPFRDIPDLSGCRVIVYYQDDVDRAADVIRREFDVIEEERSHQPDRFDPDRFGYISLHYVVKLKRNRSRLSEWRPYAGLHAEIQIRTVIQHAWSAVSHALQYKHEADVPSRLQRRLFRIAGLFELADEEFMAIRNERQRAQQSIRQELSKGDSDIPLSPTSISEFVSSWPHMKQVGKWAMEAGFTVLGETLEGYSSYTYQLTTKNGLRFIRELKELSSDVPREFFSKLMEANRSSGSTDWHVTIDFLFYLMTIYALGNKITRDELTSEGWSSSIADRVISVARAVARSQGTPSGSGK